MDRRPSDDTSNVSSPGSRFKVDVAGSSGSPAPSGSLPMTPPPEYNSAPPPDSLAVQENGKTENSNGAVDPDNRDKLPGGADALSPGSREGELSVPIIELPDGRAQQQHRCVAQYFNAVFLLLVYPISFDLWKPNWGCCCKI